MDVAVRSAFSACLLVLSLWALTTTPPDNDLIIPIQSVQLVNDYLPY